MPTKEIKYCIVLNCENDSSGGLFVGDLCLPCSEFICKGKGKHSQAYRNAKNITAKALGDAVTKGAEKLLQGLEKWQNSN